MVDLDGALKKLDRLTQEEARMALAEVLRITHDVHDEVKVVDDKVESVGDKVEDMSDRVADMVDRVEDMGDKVEVIGDKVENIGEKVEDIGDKVQSVDERVQVVIDGAPGLSTQPPIPSNVVRFRRQRSKSGSPGSKVDYSTDGKRDRRSQVFVTS